MTGRDGGTPPRPRPVPTSIWRTPPTWLDTDDDIGDLPAEYGTDLVSLGFLRAALRRGRKLWIGLAVLGLLIGAAMWASRPTVPQATTRLLLNVGPDNPAGIPILNDQVIAQSRDVAQLALHELHLHEDVATFLASYHVDVVTDQVLSITASAPSISQAVTRSRTIAAAFLTVKSRQLALQDKRYFARLSGAVQTSRHDIAAIDAHISQLAKQPGPKTRLATLRAERAQAAAQLTVLQGQVRDEIAAQQASTAAMVAQSHTLDTMTHPPSSRLKPLILFGGAGLIMGLFIGVAVIVVRALVSDRVRRRDDVARALGVPVKLSVAGGSGSRRRSRRWASAATQGDVQRIVAFLQDSLPTGTGRRALVVVPVDDPSAAAASALSLAATLAGSGSRVLAADLCVRAPLASLAGVSGPGLHAATTDGAEFTVFIPEVDQIAPIGPFPDRWSSGPDIPADRAAAFAEADVVLTLAELDAALPADHLQTWASDSVVLVTAGRASWIRLHAVGELLRLGGTPPRAAVLLGADKWDESLGVAVAAGAARERDGAGVPSPAPASNSTERRSS